MQTPRDSYPGAQTCCASPTRTPARLANSRRTWSRRRTRKSMCVPSRWKVLSGEFRRRPRDFRTLYGLKWATSVEKRHWLPISETRRCSFVRSRKIYGSPRVCAELSSDGAHVGESNSRSNVFQIPSRNCLRLQPLESSLGRVPQAADGTCNKIS